MPRVVGLQELCQQPDGAIFSEYDPCCVKGLYRRGETLCCGRYGDEKTNKEMNEYYGGPFSDFFYHDLSPCIDEATMSLPAKEHKFRDIKDGSRWGKFEPEELFVLYDENDIKDMVGLLTRPPMKREKT